MYQLQIGSTWARQIAAIRDANTEDTNLIRFDNSFYRCCRASSQPFEVLLAPAVGRGDRQLALVIHPGNFYVLSLGGQLMERYASTLGDRDLHVDRLSSAVHDIATGASSGDPAFRQRSLIVFAVAESIRSDHFATALEQSLRSAESAILGVKPELPLKPWSDYARQWGQTSDAIHAALSPQARAIVQRPRSSLTPQERQFSEAVDVTRLPGQLQACAKAIKVLKRAEPR
jgi:hypothetical protein